MGSKKVKRKKRFFVKNGDYESGEFHRLGAAMCFVIYRFVIIDLSSAVAVVTKGKVRLGNDHVS